MTDELCCPTCHRPWPSKALLAKCWELESRCRVLRFTLTVDGYLGEESTARLIGMSVYTLRNLRLAGLVPLPYRRVGRRPQYSLRDIAALLLKRTESY